MDLPPATVLFIILIAAVANIIILAAVTARVRAARAQRLVEVQGFMSSSYGRDPSDADTTSGTQETWLPSDEGWARSRHDWTVSNGWMTPNLAAERARRADPLDPAEPFEYPEPTTLEQRSAMSAPVIEAYARAELEAQLEADAETASDDEPPAEDVDETETENVLAEDEAETDDGLEAADDDETDEPEEVDDQNEEVEMIQDDEATMEAPETDGTAEAPDAEMAASDGFGSLMAGAVLGRPRGRDALTGMLDATAFEEVMAQEEAREQRYGRPATVIVFELDGLAKLVDRLGSEPGERIETALSDTIKRLARRADHVARLERGRYAVLLPETDEVAAINYVERIRRAADLWLESGAIAMRLAIGWASASGDAGLTGAVRVATERMRLELRRHSRQAGDVGPETDELDGQEAAEASSGL